MLNDWSLAIGIDKLSEIQGTPLYYPIEVLKSKINNNLKFKYFPRHDLESLVMCFYASFMRFSLDIIDLESLESIRKFWKCRLSAPYWKNILKFARDEKYKELKDSFSTILVDEVESIESKSNFSSSSYEDNSNIFHHSNSNSTNKS